MNKKMNCYSIEDLLVGQFYRSPNSYKSGTILSAEKRDEVWAGSTSTCYLIRYKSDNSIHDQYATIAVSNL